MNALAIALRELRRDTPIARAARGTIKKVLSLSVRPTALHRALLAERTLRSLVTSELARCLYWQPLFELLCAQVGEGCRLEICPDSKLPSVDNCELVLGPRVRLTARTTFQGARLSPQRPRIEIGEGSYIGHVVIFRAGLGISLGRHVTVASNVTISGDPGHPLDPIARRSEPAPRESLGRITIGDDVWIAEGCAILGQVTIGRGAVIGAHSVVTKDVPAGALVAGVPARVIRMIDETVKERAA